MVGRWLLCVVKGAAQGRPTGSSSQPVARAGNEMIGQFFGEGGAFGAARRRMPALARAELSDSHVARARLLRGGFRLLIHCERERRKEDQQASPRYGFVVVDQAERVVVAHTNDRLVPLI